METKGDVKISELKKEEIINATLIGKKTFVRLNDGFWYALIKDVFDTINNTVMDYILKLRDKSFDYLSFS